MKNKITIKKFKTFPSMEWGENGGFSCDIYYNNKKQGAFVQWGNGGTFNYTRESQDTMSEQQLNEYCKAFFLTHTKARTYMNYGEEDIQLIDLETMVTYLSCLANVKKYIKKQQKNGYTNFVLLMEKPKDYSMNECRTLASYKPIPLKRIEEIAKQHNYDGYEYVAFQEFEELESLM